jgi:uncharacterized lipoprotein YmbA
MLAAGIVLFLAGCGASPPVRFYSLQALELAQEPDAEGAATMSLGPLRLPDYLARTQFVTRGDGAEVIVDDYHRWAEPLDDAITRIVAVNVDNLVDGLIVVAFRSSNLLEYDYRLQGSVVRFDADQAGRAFLVVQWGIATPEGDVVVPPRRSEYQAQASRSGDPGAVAIALNDTVAQFSREIAGAIEGEL